jgi:ABC-2 type transport system ATP-binding protein
LSTAILITDNLTKAYGAFTALRNCSLSVNAAEVFGLLGPNGAGKTTFIRLLLGYLRPTGGTARIGGFDCVSQSLLVRQMTAYLPGDARLFPSMTGWDVLQFFADIRTQGNAKQAQKYAEQLELNLHPKVSSMSTGMRQKLALAATLAANTPLVILDEPTANLDPNVRSTVIKLVLQAKQAGRTVIFSSHVMSEVEEACDRVVILRQGELVHTQQLADLKLQHKIRARLCGNWIPPPENLAAQLSNLQHVQNNIELTTAGALAPLLGWLATLSLADLQIEPLGLRAVYDRFHAESNASEQEVSA